MSCKSERQSLNSQKKSTYLFKSSSRKLLTLLNLYIFLMRLPLQSRSNFAGLKHHQIVVDLLILIVMDGNVYRVFLMYLGVQLEHKIDILHDNFEGVSNQDGLLFVEE